MKKIWIFFYSILFSILSFSLQAAENDSNLIKLGKVNRPYPIVNRSEKQVHQDWQTIAQALGKGTSEQIVFVPYKTHQSLLNDLAKGEIGIAYVKSVPAAQVMKDNPQIKRIATAISADPVTGKKSATYSSYILTANDSSIKSIKDLNNKTIAYFDPYSASNYVALKKKLKQEGINVKWLKVPSAHAAYEAVATHKAAAVGMWDYFHTQHPEKNKFKIIGKISGLQHPSILINTQVISPAVEKKIIHNLDKLTGYLNVIDYKPN